MSINGTSLSLSLSLTLFLFLSLSLSHTHTQSIDTKINASVLFLIINKLINKENNTKKPLFRREKEREIDKERESEKEIGQVRIGLGLEQPKEFFLSGKRGGEKNRLG
jgi:hypothetical protein